jgi:hypothetical protein
MPAPPCTTGFEPIERNLMKRNLAQINLSYLAKGPSKEGVVLASKQQT